MEKLLNKSILKTLLFVIPIWILISSFYQVWFPNILFPVVWPFIMPGFLLYIFTGGSVHSVSETFVIIANYIINFVSIFIIVFYREKRLLEKMNVWDDNNSHSEEIPSKPFIITYWVTIVMSVIMPMYSTIIGFLEYNESADMVYTYPKSSLLYVIPMLIFFLFLNIWRAVKFKINRARYIVISSLLFPIIIWGLFMAENITNDFRID